MIYRYSYIHPISSSWSPRFVLYSWWVEWCNGHDIHWLLVLVNIQLSFKVSHLIVHLPTSHVVVLKLHLLVELLLKLLESLIRLKKKNRGLLLHLRLLLLVYCLELGHNIRVCFGRQLNLLQYIVISCTDFYLESIIFILK